MKVQLINGAGCIVTVSMDKNIQLYPHFKLWELANNEGDAKKAQMILSPKQDAFMLLIEQFRCEYNKPMTCNSCFRQPAYNKKIGGDKNSLHLQALAFDWGVSYNKALDNYVINTWRAICEASGKIGGLNLEPYGYHLDANEEHFGHTKFVIRNYR